MFVSPHLGGVTQPTQWGEGGQPAGSAGGGSASQLASRGGGQSADSAGGVVSQLAGGGVSWLGGGSAGWGVSQQGGGWSANIAQQNEYSLHGGQYASCVHAGGLSCLSESNGFEFDQSKLSLIFSHERTLSS